MAGNGGSKIQSKKEAYIAARLAHPAFTEKELAQSLGLSVRTSERYAADPEIQAAIQNDQKEAREIVRRALRTAAQTLVQHLYAEKEGVSLQACKLILGSILEAEAAQVSLSEDKTSLKPQIQKRTPDEIIAIIKKARGEGKE